MCGIVGITSSHNCIPDIISGLKSLEYRGYDSSGLAIINDNKLKCKKTTGKILNLSSMINFDEFKGSTAIGHTRWATHGKPNKVNTHPFLKQNCALVHNGIIENYEELLKRFSINRKNIKSETDSEIAAEVYNKFIVNNNSPLESMINLIKEIKGLYAFAFLVKGSKSIYAVRKGSPLVLGIGDNYNTICSDIIGMPEKVNKLIYLEDSDIVEISEKNFNIFDKKGKKIEREIHDYSKKNEFNSKGNYKHFMLKEIYYQPTSIEDTILNFLDKKTGQVFLPKCEVDFKQINNLYFAACGTAYHATMIASYWLEQFAEISTKIDIASEYRYRKDTVNKNSLGIVVSQSGETMDTYECLKKFKKENIYTMSIVNVLTSSIARESDYILPTLAGPEIGVASTKAFTSQLIVLALLTRHIQQHRKSNSISDKQIFDTLFELPNKLESILKNTKSIKEVCKLIKNSKSIFYIGRGTMYPLALESALKLKEITYKHCEGYAAGELKHGPLALIEKNIPIIALAPYDDNFSKILSNIQEIKAREGKIILITDKKGKSRASKYCDYIITMPETNFLTSPILYSVPIQMIAYHLGVLLGTDVDQPRNLAKSVSVE